MKILTRSYKIWALALALVAVLVVAVPAFAALGGTLTGTSLNATDCYVDVTAVVEDAGFYAINMWDDGNFRAGAGENVVAGGTLTVRFTIGGLILQGAAGIGVYLEDLAGAGATTTYDSDGSAQLWDDTVGQACIDAGYTWGATTVIAGAGGCTNPLPVGSVVYNIPDGAPAYYEPSSGASAGFNLPPGTWYISEFGDEFAKVWIACEGSQIWIPLINVLR